MYKKISLFLMCFVLMLLITGCKKNLPKEYVVEVNKTNLTNDLTYLTSKEINGRMAGKEENEKVVDYIADKFAAYKLHSPRGLSKYYIQTFSASANLNRTTNDTPPETYDFTASNVIGYLPRNNSRSTHEYLIFTAHLDHVGQNEDGSYNPGALDNGSGIIALLELARILSEHKHLLNKTIVFIAFNAEELGLIGAKHYVENPLFPLQNTEVINLDMFASSTDVPLTINSCDGVGETLVNDMSDLAKDYGFEVNYANIMRSDHAPFCQRNIPAIHLHDMEYDTGYHTPKDTSENVDINELSIMIEMLIKYVEMNA